MAAAAGLILGGVVLTSATVPEIGRAFHSTQSQLQWIADIYPLSLATVLLPSGALNDRYGRRRGLILGLSIMSVSLVWSGLAPDVSQLIASRAVTGVGAALALPPTLATLTTTGDPERRGRSIAIWVLGGMIGTFVCFLLAGFLTEYFWWGLCFVATGVLAVGCVVLAAWFTPETRDPENAHIDPMGAVLTGLGVGGLVLGVTEGPIEGWATGLTLVGLGTAVVALSSFVVWELRHPRPLLDVRLLKDPVFSTAAATLFVLFIGDYGMFSLCFQYFSYEFGYGVLQSVIRFLPATVGILIFAPISPLAVRRFGHKMVICAGVDVCAIGMFLAATVGSDGSYFKLTLCLIVFWAGVITAMIPATESVINALPPAQQGVASAVNDLARELAAAIGIAALGSAFDAGYRGRVTQVLRGISNALLARVRSSPANGLTVAHSGPAASAAVHAVRSGVLSGWRVALLTASAIVVVDAVFVAVRFPKGIRVEEPASAPPKPQTLILAPPRTPDEPNSRPRLVVAGFLMLNTVVVFVAVNRWRKSRRAKPL